MAPSGLHDPLSGKKGGRRTEAAARFGLRPGCCAGGRLSSPAAGARNSARAEPGGLLGVRAPFDRGTPLRPVAEGGVPPASGAVLRHRRAGGGRDRLRSVGRPVVPGGRRLRAHAVLRDRAAACSRRCGRSPASSAPALMPFLALGVGVAGSGGLSGRGRIPLKIVDVVSGADRDDGSDGTPVASRSRTGSKPRCRSEPLTRSGGASSFPERASGVPGAVESSGRQRAGCSKARGRPAGQSVRRWPGATVNPRCRSEPLPSGGDASSFPGRASSVPGVLESSGRQRAGCSKARGRLADQSARGWPAATGGVARSGRAPPPPARGRGGAGGLRSGRR